MKACCPLGVGFTLSGLSTISRCARNVAQDDEIAPVRDDERDALCMDGKRLVPVDHDPAQPGQARSTTICYYSVSFLALIRSFTTLG